MEKKPQIYLLFLIAFITFLTTVSCHQKVKENEVDKPAVKVAPKEVKIEKPKSQSKETIKAISGKYYIPVDASKSDLLFTINQNLNFELVKFRGSFEGKYVEDGKIKFDDKNATTIDFALKGNNIVLKNQNDVAIEFKEATDDDLLIGTWFYGLDTYKKGARMIFNKDKSWARPDDMMGSSHGTYKKTGDKKYSIIHFMNMDDLPCNLTFTNASTFYLMWDSAMGKIKDVHTRAKNGKLHSLNLIFN